MRPRKPFPEGTAERMEALLSTASSLEAYRRIQSIYFRAKYDYGAARIARMIGLKPQTVRNLHSAYRKHGEAALEVLGRGGRHHSHLTRDEEAKFLEGFEREGRGGKLVEVRGIHHAYERHLAQRVCKSTVYRLLHRHGWRKLQPRPAHPKGDPQVVEGFKKISIARGSG